MDRIVGWDGGYPEFDEIYKHLVDAYGTEGVLTKFCPDYHLYFKLVDETDARQAINERWPVVTTFTLYIYDEQWANFRKFYKTTPKGILRNRDVVGEFMSPLWRIGGWFTQGKHLL